MTQRDPNEPAPPTPRFGLVTSVRAVASRPGWVSVCVDRRRVGAITAEAAGRLGITVGGAWGEARAAGFAEESAYLGALHASVVLLRQAERSGSELAERLRGKGHAPEAIQRALGELRTRGLLDDARIAGGRAEHAARRGLAQPLIEAKLLDAGHDPETARRAAREAVREVDPTSQAERLVRGRLAIRPARAGEESQTRRRMFELLRRNGYDDETAQEALRRVMGAGAGDPELD